MRKTRSAYERPRAPHMPRTRGAVIGLLLILLGAWGALVPFFGPNINWAYSADPAWTWTTAKGWLEVLPGAVTALGGLLLLSAGNRATATFGGWLAALAGAWFVVGQAFASPLNIGGVGQPAASTDLKFAWLEVTYFTGLGALIVFLSGAALGRVAVRHARDVAVTQPAPMAAPAAAADTPPAAEPAATPARAGQVASAEREEPRRGLFHRRTGGGLFGRRHHAGV